MSTSTTIVSALEERAETTPEAAAYFRQVGIGATWTAISWREHMEKVSALSQHLVRIGLRKGERVAIVSTNLIEWEIAQMALLTCGAVAVGIDPHGPDALIAELIQSSGAVAIFLENESMLTRLSDDTRASLRWIYALQGSVSQRVPQVLSLEQFTATTQTFAVSPIASPSPSDAAIIVFSSGTTGSPKPIVYSHGQVMAAAKAILEAYPDVGQNGRSLCWLPLANLFQRMINFCAVIVGAATYVLNDPREVMSAIKQVNPKILIGVPRFFERVFGTVTQMTEKSVCLKKTVTRWALSVADSCAHPDESERAVSQSNWRWKLADRLVLHRIREAFGTQVTYLISGSAPIPPRLHRFFDGIGLPIYEAYGISESIIPVALNRPGHRRVGSVGKPLAANRVRISSDGEIEVAGPGVFAGYADEMTSSQRPDAEGYWRTGDVGRFDLDGYLFIEGRKSDWFKLSTGRWVSPLPIEQRLGALSYADTVIVLGAGRKAVLALLVVTRVPSQAQRAAMPSELSAEKIAADVSSVTADLASYQQPVVVVVLNEPLSITAGELTTNLKVRRRKLEKRYANVINRAYEALERRSSNISKIVVEFL